LWKIEDVSWLMSRLSQLGGVFLQEKVLGNWKSVVNVSGMIATCGMILFLLKFEYDFSSGNFRVN